MPPSGLEISLFLIFYTWQPLAQNSEKFAHIKHRMTQNFVFDRSIELAPPKRE